MLLGRLRVRQKLILLALPLLLLAIAGAVPLVAGRVQAAERSGDAARTVERAVRIGALVQELQQERLESLGYLTNSVARDQVVRRTAAVQSLAAQLDADYGAGDDDLRVVLDGVRSTAGLGQVRNRVLDRTAKGIDVYTGFTAATTGLIDLLRLTGTSDLRTDAGRQQLALDSIIRHDEATASGGASLFTEPGNRVTTRVIVLVSQGRALAGREEDLFTPLARTDALELYQQVEDGQSSTRLNTYLDALLGSSSTRLDAVVPADLQSAVSSLTGENLLVETRVAAQAVAGADRSARTDRWLAALGLGIALFLLVGATVLSVLITRSIARPLRRLTASADEVADVAQQELVRVADSDDPEAAVPQLRPVQVGTADEMGELAQAFNRVQQVATSLVERQLMSRQNVATMFGNVGRRTQNLVGRQLAMIDSLERNEQDPALLDRLYRLDHVSTRLRRNANSLVVLSGADDQQITGEPLTVADTIRSALGEIEGFQRVRLGHVDSVLLTPNVTPDVILLLAELLENGTSFSPPHTEVEVEAQAADGGVTIRIVDHGLGMTAEQLAAENGRLVSRERLDLAPTDVLGLFVVGRLARRHGIEVLLAPTPGTGVTAEVRVPGRHVVRSEASAVSPGAASASPPAAPSSDVSSAAAPGASSGASSTAAPGGSSGASAASSGASSGVSPGASSGASSGVSSGASAAAPSGAVPVGPAARSAVEPSGMPVPAPGDERDARGWWEGPGSALADWARAPKAPATDGRPGPTPGAPTVTPGTNGHPGRESVPGTNGRPGRDSVPGTSPFRGPPPIDPDPPASNGTAAAPTQPAPAQPAPADPETARPAPDDQAPARPAPDGLAPDRLASDGLAPDRLASDAVAPDRPAAVVDRPAAGMPVASADEIDRDVPRPRGATGMVRRIRGAQHPDTGEPRRPEPPAPLTPAVADDARQDIEDFEEGVRRALRETGADGGSGFVVDGDSVVAPWTDIDPDDPESAEQARARVEEFESGVQQALARLDQIAARPAPLFEAGVPAPRRSPEPATPPPAPNAQQPATDPTPPPAPPVAVPVPPAAPVAVPVPRAVPPGTAPVPSGTAPVPPAAAPVPPAGAPVLPAGTPVPPAGTPVPSAVAPVGPAEADPAKAGEGSLPRRRTAEGVPLVPRRLDAGAGATRFDGGSGTRPDPRPLERRRPADADPLVQAADAAVRRAAAQARTEDADVAVRRAAARPRAEADTPPGATGERNGAPGSRGTRTNPASPNGGTDDAPDWGKLDSMGDGLVRRVPGAQMPAGARGARPGHLAPDEGAGHHPDREHDPAGTGPGPDLAEQDASAARSLVEEFEAGVQRALRLSSDSRDGSADVRGPARAETDEEGAR